MAETPLPNDNRRLSFRTLVLILFGVLVLWAVVGWGVHQFAGYEGRGMFGAVNALFSGFAFACLIYAVFMQREELSLQRKELRLAREEAAATREEIMGQKEQAIAQNATLAQQTFDNTFFQLLRLHSELVNAIDLRNTRTWTHGSVGKQSSGGEIISQGRDCFSTFYNDLRRIWDSNANSNRNFTNEQTTRKEIDNIYLQFYSNHEADLGHYFRSVYNIVKFVDGSDTPNKRRYTNLVRAHLSSYEQLVLFYNCLSSLGDQKLSP